MNFSPAKRKNECDEERKKAPKTLSEADLHAVTSLNEWPVYNHPQGGTIKITPWGALRQYIANGETVTRFEDVSFTDYDFGVAAPCPPVAVVGPVSQQPLEMPSTPMSLGLKCSSPAPEVRVSPWCEAEGYVVDGYRGEQGEQGEQRGFEREQEHFFGMMDQDGED
uniref:Uncharacterized protein n=1 Tax=Candidozyma auris TaxID=498019 RepID=A0A0L0NXG6_CANAR